MSEDWKAAYPVGCRVAVDIEAWEAILGRPALLRQPYTGTVVGYSVAWPRHPEAVRVLLDGRKGDNGESYPLACVRRLVEPQEGA